MRWLTVLVILCPLPSVFAQKVTVEIGGIEITRGMLEADVRDAFPTVKCWPSPPDTSDADCYVGDGVLPEMDGFVSFIDGRVQMATRSWHIPEESGPYEVLQFVNSIIHRLTLEAGTCAEIGPAIDLEKRPNDTATTIYFPEKFLLIHTKKQPDYPPGTFFISEGLRKNPAPISSEAGKKTDATKRCALYAQQAP